MNTTEKPIESILQHAKQKLRLNKESLSITETPVPALPDRFKVFHVEPKGSHGHTFYRYVIRNGDLFSSADGDGLERLLQKENYANTRQLTADQLIILFRLLKAEMGNREIIRDNELFEDRGYKQKIEPPFTQKLNDKDQIIFWVNHLGHRFPEKWILTISHNYEVDYHQEQIQNPH